MNTIHHATTAKATKLGVVMTQDEATGVVLAHWAEKNKRAYSIAGQAPGVLEDMRTWQMLVREYSHLKVGQPYVKDGNYVWEIELRGKVIGEGARLNDAFEDALDAISKPAKSAKPLADRIDDGEATDTELAEVAEEKAAEGDDEEEADEGKSVVKKRYKSAYRPFRSTCGDELAQLVTKHLQVKTEDGVRMDRAKLVRFAKANGVWEDGYKHLNNGLARMAVLNRIRAKVRRESYEIAWN